MNPQVSVVIPAYNAMRFIDDCLASVVGQRVPFPLEIIAVNDGSTDGTLEKLHRIPGLICLTQNNLGPAAARNAGIRQARGEFVAFLDADDLWPEGKLQKQVALLRQNPGAAICFGDCRQFEADRWWPRTLFEVGDYGERAWGSGLVPLPNAYARLLEDNFITTGSVVVRRQVLEAVGGFDESLRLVEDLDLWLRIARQHPIAWCKDVCLLRRRHAGNTSREQEAMSLAYMEVLKRQQTCCQDDLDRLDIDLNKLFSREYQALADRALADHRSRDALRWAWRSFHAHPGLRPLWRLLQGTGQQLTRQTR